MPFARDNLHNNTLEATQQMTRVTICDRITYVGRKRDGK
jgi:hypothetical protein